MPQATSPEVTFFVESREESQIVQQQKPRIRSRGQFLLDRLGGGDVVNVLREVHGRLSIAMSSQDISGDNALVEFLREMSILDVGIDIWPTLSDEDGYWIHAGNGREAYIEVFRIIEALERKGVDFQNIGLDLEFPIGLMQGGSLANTLRQLMKIRPWRFSQADAAIYIKDLMQQILANSKYGVHTYEVPILSDNDRLRRFLGIPQAPVTVRFGDYDRDYHGPRHKRVALTYTSATPKFAARDPAKFVREYSGGRGRIPALGIVSASEINPGRDLGGRVQFLNDEALKRDVRAALEVSPTELFIFALNGKPVIDRTRAAIEATIGAYFPVKVAP
jgi:hypothetical protein